MKIINLVLLCSALMILSCSKVEEGSSVLPTVDATCTTSSCKSASGTTYFYSFVSASGCNGSSIAYDLRATGVATAVCTSLGGCKARVTTWTDPAGKPFTQIKDSSYDVCSVFFIGGINGTDPVDAYASHAYPKQVIKSQPFNSSQTQITLSSFADL